MELLINRGDWSALRMSVAESFSMSEERAEQGHFFYGRYYSLTGRGVRWIGSVTQQAQHHAH